MSIDASMNQLQTCLIRPKPPTRRPVVIVSIRYQEKSPNSTQKDPAVEKLQLSLHISAEGHYSLADVHTWILLQEDLLSFVSICLLQG